jgi:DNA repair exonuclease SbcCD ATPase subunit
MKIRIGSLLDQETINNKYTALGDIVKFSSFTESKINNLKSVFETMLCPTCTQPYPEVKIKSAREEYDILSGKLSRLRESENGLRIIIEKYQVVERELSLLMKDYEHKDNEIKSLQDKLKTPSIDLEEIKSDLDILVMEVNLIQERINEVSLNMSNSEYIHDLLLPSSQFRTKVLERYLSFINSLISSITPLLYGEVSIKLEVDPKGHGVFLQIMKGTTEYNYKSLSGGEKRRVDIIIILAMQRFLIESSGFSSNLLVFDEIFDNLDKMGVQNVLSCIDTLFPESSCIYIITHNDSIKSLFNSVVRVVKEDDISRIEAHEVINE